MPIYEMKDPITGKVFEVLRDVSKRDDEYISPEGNKCFRMMSKVIGVDGNPEPWHYEDTKRLKPKFVKDSKGNRHKYDPTKFTPGKGRG